MLDHIQKRIEELQEETRISLTALFHKNLKEGVKPTTEELIREYPEFARHSFEDFHRVSDNEFLLYSCPEFLAVVDEESREQANNKYYQFEHYLYDNDYCWDDEKDPERFVKLDCSVVYCGAMFNPHWIVTFETMVAMRKAFIEKRNSE